MQPVIQYAQSGDVSIAYQVVGDGPIDLVIVPGWVSHLELVWEEPQAAAFLRRLGEFSRLILFDKRGTGMSDPMTYVPPVDERMDDIRAVMDAAGSERAAMLGYSEGAPLALVFAAIHPDRTSAVIAYAGFARLMRATDNPTGFSEDVLKQFIETSVRAGVTGEFYDWVVPSRQGDDQFREWFARIIPGAKYVELAGGDHWPWFGDTEAVVEEVEEFLTGMRHTGPVDRVLATVMFTDIVGSTEHLARVGDKAWRQLLDQHDSVTGRQVERFRGRALKHTGDGVLATFDGPARAVQCARTIQDATRAIGLEVRVGLHVGECELRGADIGGLAVHIAARVAEAAGAGEILVSGTVRDLVAASGLEFSDCGARELKGIPGEWRLFSVQQP